MLQKNCETVDKKSSQTSEMAVKISEKHSEIALERALTSMRRRTRDYTAEWPMYNDTVLCCLFESQNVPKSCSLLPNVGSAEHRKIEF